MTPLQTNTSRSLNEISARGKLFPPPPTTRFMDPLLGILSDSSSYCYRARPAALVVAAGQHMRTSRPDFTGLEFGCRTRHGRRRRRQHRRRDSHSSR